MKRTINYPNKKPAKVIALLMAFLLLAQQSGVAEVIELSREAIPDGGEILLTAIMGCIAGATAETGQSVESMFIQSYLVPKAADFVTEKLIFPGLDGVLKDKNGKPLIKGTGRKIAKTVTKVGLTTFGNTAIDLNSTTDAATNAANQSANNAAQNAAKSSANTAAQAAQKAGTTVSWLTKQLQEIKQFFKDKGEVLGKSLGIGAKHSASTANILGAAAMKAGEAAIYATARELIYLELKKVMPGRWEEVARFVADCSATILAYGASKSFTALTGVVFGVERDAEGNGLGIKADKLNGETLKQAMKNQDKAFWTEFLISSACNAAETSVVVALGKDYKEVGIIASSGLNQYMTHRQNKQRKAGDDQLTTAQIDAEAQGLDKRTEQEKADCEQARNKLGSFTATDEARLRELAGQTIWTPEQRNELVDLATRQSEAQKAEIKLSRTLVEAQARLTPEERGRWDMLVILRQRSDNRDKQQGLEARLAAETDPAGKEKLRARINARKAMVGQDDYRISQMTMSNGQALLQGLEIGAISAGLQIVSRKLDPGKDPLANAYGALFVSNVLRATLIDKKNIFYVEYKNAEFQVEQISDPVADRAIQGEKRYSWWLKELSAGSTEAMAGAITGGRATSRLNKIGQWELDYQRTNDTFWVARTYDFIKDAEACGKDGEANIMAAISGQLASGLHYRAAANIRDVLQHIAYLRSRGRVKSSPLVRPDFLTLRRPSMQLRRNTVREMVEAAKEVNASSALLKTDPEKALKQDLSLIRGLVGPLLPAATGVIVSGTAIVGADALDDNLLTAAGITGAGLGLQYAESKLGNNMFTFPDPEETDISGQYKGITKVRAELEALGVKRTPQQERLLTAINHWATVNEADQRAFNHPGAERWQYLQSSYGRQDLDLRSSSPIMQALAAQRINARVEQIKQRKIGEALGRGDFKLYSESAKTVADLPNGYIGAQAAAIEKANLEVPGGKPGDKSWDQAKVKADRENEMFFRAFVFDMAARDLNQQAVEEAAPYHLTRLDTFQDSVGVARKTYDGWQKDYRPEKVTMGQTINNNYDFSVRFAFDKYNISQDGQRVVNEMAAVLKANPDARLEPIVGRTDQMGSDEYNMLLGQRRADAIRGALLGADVKEIQLPGTISRGEKDALGAPEQLDKRALDRRTDVQISFDQTRTEVMDFTLQNLQNYNFNRSQEFQDVSKPIPDR